MLEIDGRRLLMEIPGRWRLRSDSARPLAPGDMVAVKQEADELRLTEPLPRLNEFTRCLPGSKRRIPQTMAANIDQVMIFASAVAPETPNGLIDRLLVTAALGDVPAVLLVNKTDLATDERLEYLRKTYKNAVGNLYFSSALSGEGLASIEQHITRKVTLFAGSSGVGKSTIANCFDPKLNLKTGSISDYSNKGRHITSTGELHRLSRGGWIVDTPGLRECAPWNMTKERLRWCFKEFHAAADDCHFRDCLHHHETGCAVKALVGTPGLPGDRYTSYLKLLDEALD